ncbi:unnamed protein product [Urochloa decumbens]|uniref:BTB domain-containing protein n=1 Tax=Urochloa decumbens TaxID=240449 RepID=A0ABC9C0U7_9POAL
MEVKGSSTLEMTGVLAQYPAVGGEPLYVTFPLVMLQSTIFVAGGYYWSVRLYHTDSRGVIDCFSVSLQLMSSRGGGAAVRASHELSVLDPSTTLPPRSLSTAPPRYFVPGRGGDGDGRLFSSAGVDLDRAYLEDQCRAYVRHGRLLFQCTVTVFPEEPDRMAPGAFAARIEVPPSDMLGRLGKVLEMGEGADVTFSVEGELFPAHKVILAMRSPVFKAELYGEMRENANGAAQAIVIGDMRADTFRALLRYIYTDASPAAITSNGDNQDEGDNDDDSEDDSIRVWELLTAADRYDVQRLKLMCERVLCKRLDVENVADTLALADQHHCDKLKDACIEFMTTSQRMGRVAATQGYMQLKSSHPHLVFEVLEKSSNFQKHVE